MATDEVRRRPKKKFSLLLSPITLPPPHHPQNQRSYYMKYLLLLVIMALFLTYHFSPQAIRNAKKRNVHHKFDKPNVIQATYTEEEDALDYSNDENIESHYDTAVAAAASNMSRPFQYIGDIDPASPRPWPKQEADWWSLHQTLVDRVKESESFSIKKRHDDDDSLLPQLIFYGDSITEGWNGTSFGNIPGPTRMWGEDEPSKIRKVFEKHFGSSSVWGQRAILPPLILGISGSRTYDFIWRIENGEFPKSTVLSEHKSQKLQRIYIVLMGTNNLGGGMLPDATISGMDASGRKILELHQQQYPTAPAAIVFSELLPRKDDHRAVKMCPPRCANVTALEPFQSFMPAIQKVNEALPGVLRGWKEDYPDSKIVLLSSQSEDDANGVDSDNIPIIQCGQDMFAFDSEEEFDAHMPDRLHPNAKGYDVWARCIKRGLEEVMDHTINLL
jgi:lysophospholipase L1-like esterase